MIVNAKKSKTNNVYLYLKHHLYIFIVWYNTETKASEWLINFFKLSWEVMICHHCLYKTDTDSEYVNSTNYMPIPKRISKEYIRKF